MPVRTLLAVLVVLLAPAFVRMQSKPQQSPASKPAPFKAEELEQIVAPVALHPDSLLSQILMASTYPLEVVEAARWVKANQSLKGGPLTAALEKKDWDPSVKSLVNFPQVLAMMDDKLEWTQKLGDAVLAQQKEVMEAVQRLRKKAKDSGNLESAKEQKVTVEQPSQTIVIEAADPQVIYVPTYNPTVVYGTWPYPSYPPYYYYPPGYSAGTVAFSFAAGVAIGAAWGYAWGGCHWGHSEVDIDINRNTTINNNIDRSKYQNQAAARTGTTSQWQHDASHRKGVSYRDQATAQRYQKGGAVAKDTGSREQFRGHADKGRQDLARDPTGGAAQRPTGENRPGASNRPDAANRAGAAKPAGTKQTGTSRQGAFDSYGSGSEVKSQSNRGQSSRQSSSSPTVRSGASGRSGGGRGGGGGRR